MGRLKTLKDLAAPIFARVREHRERPEWLDNLKQSLNHSTTFLQTSKALIIDETPKPKEDGKVIEGDTQQEGEASEADPKNPKEEKTEKAAEEEKLFKEKELEQLEKKIAEVEKWRDEKLAEQEATPLSEMPKLTVSMINSKIGDLESEVQFLIRKAKMKKAELERARLKAEADAAKAEADKKKAEKKRRKRRPRRLRRGRLPLRRRWLVRREKVLHLQKLLLQKMESLFLLKKNQNLKLTVPRSQKWGRRRKNLLTLKSMLSCDNT